MNNLNTVLPNGTFGVAVSTINSNFSLIVSAINSLEYASTKSRGIYNYGFTPSTSTLPNAVKGDWCMVLGEGNTFPADIYTFNGTSWSKGGTWNPEGIDLTQYPTKSEMNAAIAAIEIETVDNLNEETAASGKALDAHQGFVLAGQIEEVKEDLDESFISISSGYPDSDLDITDENNNRLVSFRNGGIITKLFDSTKTPQQEDATADFDIADENGNVLVRFKNGHIKTKRFDSSNIGYKNLEGKTVSILGDSISTFQGYIPSDYAYFYPAGNLTNVADTWWQKMVQETKLTLLKNCSWSGSDMCGDSTSTTNAKAGCSTKRVSDLADGNVSPDIVVVYIGINDFYHAGNITLGTWTPKNEIPVEGTINHFSEAYALCLHKIMLAYPNAEIYCCSLLECKTADTDNRYPVINSNNEYLIDFNNKIKEIADGLGVYFIDVHSCGINYWNGQGDTLIDSTHPNVKGAELVGKCIANTILSLTKKYQ